QAQREEYAWLWVDTCCIDKQSIAEPSILFTGGMRIRRYALMPASMTRGAHPFPLRVTS
ncbi:hypothetical protein SCLCIDRAFT_126417, partial [Scleroderma citrinum Foug A]